jgi:6-phospho-beta-glucosidase
LVYGALVDDTGEPRVDEVALYDVDPTRLRVIEAVLAELAAGRPSAPRVLPTTDLDQALTGADFVFSAVRVGGLAARTQDEHVALGLGVIGQETTGPGGVSFGLRTVPAAARIAERVRAVCPEAWVINFTNPAGMVTEAMQHTLGEKVIGICDSPIELVRRCAAALGVDATSVTPDYVGLNHLGWLRALRLDGVDLLPRLLDDDACLAGIEEARLFGLDWVRARRAIPNEYLYYYDFRREALESIRTAPLTRGDQLLDQQAAFYDRLAAHPEGALAEWRRVRRERDESYMAELREETDAGERRGDDVESGGYEKVALAFMSAASRGTHETMILNLRNGSTVPGLPADAVVEVPCEVDGTGPRALPIDPVDLDELGLMQQVKGVERLTIDAALTGDPAKALRAFAAHPLVDSVSTARALLAGYRAAIPEVDAVFR